jgi:hypothetical protein
LRVTHLLRLKRCHVYDSMVCLLGFPFLTERHRKCTTTLKANEQLPGSIERKKVNMWNDYFGGRRKPIADPIINHAPSHNSGLDLDQMDYVRCSGLVRSGVSIQDAVRIHDVAGDKTWPCVRD